MEKEVIQVSKEQRLQKPSASVSLTLGFYRDKMVLIQKRERGEKKKRRKQKDKDKKIEKEREKRRKRIPEWLSGTS